MKRLNSLKKALAVCIGISCASMLSISASAETTSTLFHDDFSAYASADEMSANWYLKEYSESVAVTDINDAHGNVLEVNAVHGCPVVAMPKDTIATPVISGNVELSYDIYLDENTDSTIQGFIALVADGQQNYGSYRAVEVYSNSDVTMVRSAQDNSKYANISKGKWYTVKLDMIAGITSGSYTVTVTDANGQEIWSYSQSDFAPLGQWKNINFTSWSNGSYYIDNVTVNYYAPDTEGSYSVDYNRTAEYTGYAGGTVTITPSQDMKNIYAFGIYWGDDNGILDDYTPIGKIYTDGTNPVEMKIRDDIMIPVGANRIIAAVQNGGAINTIESAEIPAEAIITPGEELFSFEVISDTHTSNKPTDVHNAHILMALNDIKTNAPESAAIFINGDIVDANTDDLWETFKVLVNQSIGDSVPIYYSIGNHELRPGTKDDYDELVAKYIENTETDSLYYYKKINGQYFIILGNEKMVDGGDIAYLYQAQLDWLEEILDRAEAEGTRAYVFLHQPLQNTVSSSMAYTTRPIQRDVAQDAEIRSIIDAHPNTIMFSSHGHRELESAHPALIRNTEGANYFDTAAVAYLVKDNGTSIEGSQGLYVKVYSDKIIVRGRDFLSGKWISNAQFLIDTDNEDNAEHSYVITGVSANETGVTATVSGSCAGNAVLIAAIYDSDNKLIGTTAVDVPAGEYEGYDVKLEYESENTSYAVLYIWDGLSTMKPLGIKKTEKAKDVLLSEMSDIGLKKVISWDKICDGAKTSF